MNFKKRILLVGGGHANIQVLHRLAHLDPDSISVTLISDVMESPYSGMIPSFMAGIYSSHELHFNLKAICARHQFQFVHAEVKSVNANDNFVQTADGITYSYDICSINLGIQSAVIPTDAADQTNVIYLKPISKFISLWQKMLSQAVRKIMVIGGGAAAFEVAVACRRKFGDAEVTMVCGLHGLLPEVDVKLRAAAKFSLLKQKVNLIENVKVEKINTEHVELSDRTDMPRQYCLIATSAQVSPIFFQSHLPTNAQGFVRIDEFLRVEGYKNIFAAGDCCEFGASPLPKAGVFAVRQGPILYKNITALLTGSKMKKYKPQKHFLKIMVCGNNQAFATYRKFYLKGVLAWKLKDYIDRRFMRQFQ